MLGLELEELYMSLDWLITLLPFKLLAPLVPAPKEFLFEIFKFTPC
jgi:hypothetical protein